MPLQAAAYVFLPPERPGEDGRALVAGTGMLIMTLATVLATVFSCSKLARSRSTSSNGSSVGDGDDLETSGLEREYPAAPPCAPSKVEEADDASAHLPLAQLRSEVESLERAAVAAMVDRIFSEACLAHELQARDDLSEELAGLRAQLDVVRSQLEEHAEEEQAKDELSECGDDLLMRSSCDSVAAHLGFAPSKRSPELDDVLILWDELSVPLYHRARFYGGPGNAALRESPPVVRLELARLAWLRDYADANPDFAKRAKGDLVAERAALVEGLRTTPRTIRENMLRAWGLDPRAREGQRKTIQRLVSQLWTSAMAPEKSAIVVLLLNEGTLDRKTRFVHFSSLYAMAAQGATLQRMGSTAGRAALGKMASPNTPFDLPA